MDTQSEDFTREILTACVEAYACVLTGSDGTWWTEAEISTSADTLTVSLEESYRTFLYLDQAPRGIDRDRGAVEFQAWTPSSGGCLLMIDLFLDVLTDTGLVFLQYLGLKFSFPVPRY